MVVPVAGSRTHVVNSIKTIGPIIFLFICSFPQFDNN
jgi:hypothetical protein